MGRVYSDKEKKLQRKLIPFNIVAIIISLVCIFSLMFTPIVKIDVGKILSDDALIATLNDEVGKMIAGESSDGGEEGEESGEGSEAVVDYLPVISTVLSTVFKKAEGALTISAQSASKVAFAPEDEKAKIAMDELLFGDTAIIGGLIKSIINELPTIFDNDGTKRLIEEAMVKAIISSLVSDLPAEAAEKLTPENVSKLTDSLKKLESIPEGQTVEDVADGFVKDLSEILGEDFNAETDGDAVRDYIIDNYDETRKYTEDGAFSLEALISVTVSKNMDLSGFNGLQSQTGPEGGVHSKRTVDEAVTDGADGEDEGNEPPAQDPSETDPDEDNDGEEGEENGTDPSEGDPDGGEEPETPPTGEEPEIPSEEDGERVICTTYSQLLKQMGLDMGSSELSGNLKAFLQNLILDSLGEYSNYLAYYGYVYYVMLGFSALWALMILFAFLHIFLKNKRFTMWYVKLLGGIPALIWVALALGKLAVTKGWFGIDSAILGVVLGGVSSAMWICGLCYLLLWLISIFWAFPIKRKIKKERKANK